MKITLLGPLGANFSDLARKDFGRIFDDHFLQTNDRSSFLLVDRNEDVLPSVIKDGGLGVVAMNTEAEGVYEAPFRKVVALLDHYDNSGRCPVALIAALEKRVRFTLMVKKGTEFQEIQEVCAHPKSLGACRNNIRAHGWRPIECNSNGKAAEYVARDPRYTKTAVLGPREAVETFKELRVVPGYEALEDNPATTIFHLWGPRSRKRIAGLRENNMIVLACRLFHKPNAKGSVMNSFGKRGINMLYDTQVFVGAAKYDHIFLYECRKDQVIAQREALQEVSKNSLVERCLMLGPVPIVKA
ncbi:hypothetical protein A2738_02855 [Candidatus Nomurabacteria bacterium RIFCSPHIGHO2_01_FULL_42_15]|uniref:Prephenate dehydratase domain-containing protein n=1 Tax=Candidatus Nomurabacteria bacterium RIFCSPHIGHO2_01_FULL_42_15 TaxID=1801742 RepID=A0A1F6VEP0_9BACT|nr:MAG: hypothetical protein A2738_02855 [Candidatus Nomurabacteria bacterium RIFCSPHIGHO2_01_FULL_42_15]OGI92808.1 MAG: hypothetical protein A3A99_02920 [Candidatus Nomurabacteria bacterium RIFCSPLOWO2_01_FULL_41_18]